MLRKGNEDRRQGENYLCMTCLTFSFAAPASVVFAKYLSFHVAKITARASEKARDSDAPELHPPPPPPPSRRQLRTESKEQLVRRSLNKEKSCGRRVKKRRTLIIRPTAAGVNRSLFFFFSNARALIRAPVDLEFLINPMSASKGGRGGHSPASAHLSLPSPPHFPARPVSLSELLTREEPTHPTTTPSTSTRLPQNTVIPP